METFLVAQWEGIHLPMQETRVQSLVRDDPHTMEQLRPCATATEPAGSRAWEPQLLKPVHPRAPAAREAL